MSKSLKINNEKKVKNYFHDRELFINLYGQFFKKISVIVIHRDKSRSFNSQLQLQVYVHVCMHLNVFACSIYECQRKIRPL